MIIRSTLVFLSLAVAAGCTLYHDDRPDDRPPLYTDAGSPSGFPDAGDWWGPDASPWADAPPALPDSGFPVPDAGHADDGGLCECAAVTSEAVCVVRPDCRALYEGIDCECYADGTCACDAWRFERCE